MAKQKRQDNPNNRLDNPNKGLETRCNPSCVSSLVKVLPPAAVERIKELGFSKLLELQLDSLSSRKDYGLLMKEGIVHEDANRIEFHIRDDVSLWITPDVVKHVIPLPNGSVMELPKSKDAEEEYGKMLKALICIVTP